MNITTEYLYMDASKGEDWKRHIESLAKWSAKFHGNSELQDDIQWIDELHPSKEEAILAMKNHEIGLYDQIALKYLEEIFEGSSEFKEMWIIKIQYDEEWGD